MHVTIIKETGSNQLNDAAHIVNSQKLIVSTALNRFTPFQFVLVPVSSQSLALCQVIKKPDLHQNYCYLNTSVICCKRKAESSRVNEQIGRDVENVSSNKVKDDSDIKNEFINKNCTNKHSEGDVFLSKVQLNADGTSDVTISDMTLQIDKNDFDIKSEFTSDLSGVGLPNVFEEFSGNKIDLVSIVELTDEVEHCKSLNVTVVVNEFYQGTSEEFCRLVQQILTMFTFTSHCFINVNLENIHSIIIHDATPSTPSKPTRNPTLSKSNSSNLQTPTAQHSRTPSSRNTKRRQSKPKTLSRETRDEDKTPNTADNIRPTSNLNASPCAFNNPSQSLLNSSSLSFQSKPTNSSRPPTTPNSENATSNISTTVKSDPNSQQSNSEISQSISSTIVPNQTNANQTTTANTNLILEKVYAEDSKKELSDNPEHSKEESSQRTHQTDSANTNSIPSTDSNDTNKKGTSQTIAPPIEEMELKTFQFKREPQIKSYQCVDSTLLSTDSTHLSTDSTHLSTDSTHLSTNSAKISTNSAQVSTNSAKLSTNSAQVSTNSAKLSTNSAKLSTKATQLMFVSPKTKLSVENIHSVDYYKQRIRFRSGCGCVEEYVHCSEAWRRMKQLMECRKRAVEVTADGKQLNSASKILLSGPSGSGKTYLVRTLARALALPLIAVTSSELSASSPGVAESNLRAKFFQARALAKENKGLCILLFEQIHDLIPASPPSLSHIIRLSLSLTSLLDATPPSSPLLFIFTSTSAHSIGARLKAHAHVYLTAPGSDMRRAILRLELAPISILSESARERSRTRDSMRRKSSRVSILDVSDEKSKSDSVAPESIPEESIRERLSATSKLDSDGQKSIPEESIRERLSATSKLDSDGQKSIPEESIRERLVSQVLAVTGSFLPVDLMRLAGVVTHYVARNRRFSTECLTAHVHAFLSHYRPSCLKAGGLGVIDLPSGGPAPPDTRPELEMGSQELLEDCEREERIQGGHELQEGRRGIESEASARRMGPSAAEWVPELGGLREVRALIEKKVEWPFKYAAAFERLGIPRSKGILLYGPPGCAKTSLVRGLASSSCRLLAVSAAQLYSPYVGEAEANVAQLFHRARTAAPAILFIDEIDALVGNRSEGRQDVQQSVLSVFLNEMDGVGVKPEIGSAGGGVMVIAATNRPSCLDSALVRPGRLDTLIYVRPPDFEARRQILALVSGRGRMGADVDFERLAAQTELYSGADLASLYTEAALISLLDKGFDNTVITQAHWLQALSVTRPSLTLEQLAYYEAFEQSV